MSSALPLRPLLAGALLGLNLGVQAAPAPAQITFDTTPRAGQHQRQTLDIQATIKTRAEPGPDATDEQRAKIAQVAERMAQMGAMKMAMQMQQTMQVGQADADGWLPMTVTVASKSGQMTVGDKVMPLPKQPGRDLGFVARFNPKDFAFEVQSVEGSPQFTELMRAQGNTTISQMLQLSKALNQRPIKVGESVEVPLTMALPMPLPGGAGQMGGRVRYTLARVERGVAYFDLGMDIKMDIDAPVPTPAAAASAASASEAASAPAAADTPPKTLHVHIDGSGKGKSALRLADRLPLSHQLSLDMQMQLGMPDNGQMFVDMAMTMQSKGESLAKPAKPDAKKKS